MKFYENGAALAKDMGVPLQTLEAAHQQHFEASKKMEKDPEGGSWPAYPSGKSWDEPSGKTGSGKKFYHNVIPGDKVASEPFYVAIITPVIHYCMGGLEIDTKSRVLKPSGVIEGLYAAGELAGGVHGNNRLGGNSLLDCVVFGRVSGVDCAKYMLGGDVKKVDLKEIAARKPIRTTAGEAPAAAPAAAAAPAHVKIDVPWYPQEAPPAKVEGNWAFMKKSDDTSKMKKVFLGAIACSFLFSYTLLSAGGYGGFTVHH
jgi:hypothetical protein